MLFHFLSLYKVRLKNYRPIYISLILELICVFVSGKMSGTSLYKLELKFQPNPLLIKKCNEIIRSTAEGIFGINPERLAKSKLKK